MVRSDNTLAFDKMNQISHDNSPSLFEGDARSTAVRSPLAVTTMSALTRSPDDQYQRELAVGSHFQRGGHRAAVPEAGRQRPASLPLATGRRGYVCVPTATCD